MKSFIASLRSLTLPFGATSGPRIVLNGALGRIEVYSNAGNLMITIDDDGILVFDADGDNRLALATTTGFSSLILKDTAGLNSSIITYEPIPGTNDFRAVAWQAPDTVKDFLRLILLSPTNTTKNPLFQVDTGLLTSDVAQPIIDLTGFTGSRAAVVAADDYKIAASNGGGNAPTLGKSLPRGVIARGRRTTNLSFSTEAQIAQASPTVTLISGRRYRFELSWRSIIWDSATATALARLRIKDLNSTVRMEWIDDITGGTARRGSSSSVTLDCPGEIGSGSHDFEATAERITGTGTLALEAAGTYPCTLTVEDVGDTG